MSKEELESLTYKELVRELIKRLDDQSDQIKSIDDRERLLQKTLERLMGRIEGEKTGKREEGGEWKWKATYWLGVVSLIISIMFAILSVVT